MNSSSKPNSRFSSLRVFRFPPKSDPLPPPLPPKDPYYLSNRSLASLSPDSLPGSPLSSQYARRMSPAPYQSTMSLVSTAVSLSPDATSSMPRKPKRERSIFRFVRRSQKSPTNQASSPKSPSMSEAQSSPSAEDDNISRPWNFQHHTHVDEGLGGLPPSWSASLAEAGFSEDEIEAIRARRAATLLASHSLYNGQPLSPAASSPIRPTPRTTSLPRQFVDSNQHPRPPQPFVHTNSHSSSLRKLSSDSNKSSSPSSSTLDISREADLKFMEIRNNHEQQPSVSTVYSSRHTRSRTSSSVSVADFPTPHVKAHTPPKRVLHVVNGAPSPGVLSPPPAYDTTEDADLMSDSKDFTNLSSSESGSSTSIPSAYHTPNDEVENDSSPPVLAKSKAAVGGKSFGKKLTSLPPRLSLHDNSGDLSSWSKALLSAIPSEPSDPRFSPSSTDQLSPPSFPKSPLSSSYPSPPDSQAESAPPANSRRRLSSLKSVSSIWKGYVDDDSSLPPPTDRSPLWDELMGMVQEAAPALDAPALNETMSPTLPCSPSERERTFKVNYTKTDSTKPGTEEEQQQGEEEEVDEGLLSPDEREHESNRDSGTSSVSTATVTVATVVHKAAVAKRATANFFDPLQAKDDDDKKAGSSPTTTTMTGRSSTLGSPQSSNFSSNGSSESGSPSLQSQDHQAQYPEVEVNYAPRSPAYLEFLEAPPLPDKADFGPSLDSSVLARSDTFGLIGKEDTEALMKLQATIINALPTPVTARRYRGWLSEVVAPLEEFIDHHTDPRDHYVDLQEVAEGESGSVFSARVVDAHKLTFPITTHYNHGGVENAFDGSGEALVAIKNVPILPSGSPKLNDLQRELALMKGVRHEYVLGMDALYVNLAEDSLWIRMELMERSLADVVGLVEGGLMVQERMIARFASDVLLALDYLQAQGIAHRDLRSDNLLLNMAGALKIADFSSAVRVTAELPIRSDVVGVIYWQAPEMRIAPYNALKVDVWSLGATVWEMAQAKPPFADVHDPRQIGDQWPPLSQPEIYSRSFHEFLRLCSLPASSRPNPASLSDTAFVRNACGRPVIIQLLSQCRAIEERMLQETADS